MNIGQILTNPFVIAMGKELLEQIVKLVKSVAIPKAKRLLFEELVEKCQEYGQHVLDLKVKVESTPTQLDDEAYQLSKEAFRKLIDEMDNLYQKM